MASYITAEELFRRVLEITRASSDMPTCKMMHDTLVLTCSEGLAGSNMAFGNLFSQVDFLCKLHNVNTPDTIAIQRMRRNSNHTEENNHDDAAYDCRALAKFISAVFETDIPSFLVGRLPVTDKPNSEYRHIDYRYIRCIVQDFDDKFITAEIDQESTNKIIKIDYTAEHLRYIQNIIKPQMQLNLIDCSAEDAGCTVIPLLIIIEPDFLIDISSIARCFTDYGHSHLAYITNSMSPAANSQAILIGNFAGQALDDIINNKGKYNWTETFKNNFKDKALEYCTCEDLNKNGDFRTAAIVQTQNIRQIAASLFGEYNGSLAKPDNKLTYDRSKAILEPSFVCEQLGLQGRVDLMTTDFSLLVEQKSGTNYNIQRNIPNEFGSFQKEDHYVQLLLYYGILKQNFHVGSNKIDIRLLYSKYPLPGGLVAVNFYQKLFREAIRFRNILVANEYSYAIDGFDGVIEQLTPDNINENNLKSNFFCNWIQPQLNKVFQPLHSMSSLEKTYFNRMMTFIYREQLANKVGTREGTSSSIADLWNMPLAEKKETGNIYTGLRIINKDKSNEFNGYDTITLSVPNQGFDFLPNFRLGDMIYLYSYHINEEPDVRKALLFKGNLTDIHSKKITVHLTDGQQNPAIFEEKAEYTFAIEHSGSDASATSALRSLHEFASACKSFKDLLLCQRQPRTDINITLNNKYNPTYDDIILKAKQAQDYFLLVGPPGTGKTSMALQYMAREFCAEKSSILIMSYTNRAVDEICEMLGSNGLEYIRIGNEYTCDEHYRSNLLSSLIEECPKLNVIRQRLLDCKIIVGTTSTIHSKSYLFKLKHFSRIIIDEASQILEPNLIGLLSLAQSPFILIGDYKQLPAVVQQSPSESAVKEHILNDICLDNCRNSLFERLFHWEKRQGRKDCIGILRRQGRMHPEIADFPNKMFYFNENLKPVPLKHQLEKELTYTLPPYDDLDKSLKQNRLLFIPSHFCKSTGISDKVNTEEAAIVAEVLRRIYRFYGNKFNPDKTVGVIVPYRNQIAMIRKNIEKLGITQLENISIDTVERYQGSQRDVIIYSFTIQNIWQLDFLTSNSFEEDGHIIDRKLNVAITRARKQLILTGNKDILCNNMIFKQLINHIEQTEL